MFDLLIKNAIIYDGDKKTDIGIKEGKIAEIRAGIEQDAAREIIEADGKVVSPGFVDSHMHLDKTMTGDKADVNSLEEAIAGFIRYTSSFSRDEWKADVKRRAREATHQSLRAGTTTLRTHINIDARFELAGVEAINELKEELRNLIDIKITTLPTFFDGNEAERARFELLDHAAQNGMIDFIGGAPHVYDNWESLTEKTFDLAVRYGLPIDLHVDESDHPDVRNFEQIADLTMKYDYQGKVSCGHVTALNAVDDETARRVIEKAARAELNIITLPSCNLYLMGRQDKEPVRKGTTRIGEFIEAGVNIAYASDNVRDIYHPAGNADMLEEGLLTAKLARMIKRADLKTIFKMGTVNPARALLLDNYGLEAGKQADLIILDASNTAEALLSQVNRDYVIKKGKVVVRNNRSSEIIL